MTIDELLIEGKIEEAAKQAKSLLDVFAIETYLKKVLAVREIERLERKSLLNKDKIET